MPSLTIIKILCDLTFVSKMKKLPVNWQQPTGEPGKQYPSGFKTSELAVPPEPLCYFWCASTNKKHVDSSKEIGKQFKDFAHAMLDAVKFAHDMWRLEAKFKDLKVMAVCAIGTPGCLDGPELESNIKNAPMTASFTEKNMKAWRDACAKGISKCFKDWQGKVMVPGLPWYPAFAAFPGPTAPPMPNIPMPLITCPSPMMASITVPSQLASAMQDNFSLDDPDDQFKALSESLAVPLALAFLMWMPMQQIMLVMGKGPIPTFAPPYLPVGTVLAGDNISAPGHLMV